MDTVLRDVRVIDGSGGPSYRADVALADGRIAEIHRETDGGPRPSAARTVDGHGLALSPGFIDMHAHSDLALLRDPAHEAKAAQGVTLEVLGQDGLSYAPVDDRTLAEVRTQITGWNGGGPGAPTSTSAGARSADTSTASTTASTATASPSTPPTSSRRAPSGCSPSAGTTGTPPPTSSRG